MQHEKLTKLQATEKFKEVELAEMDLARWS